jgi:hypothetical protein
MARCHTCWIGAVVANYVYDAQEDSPKVLVKGRAPTLTRAFSKWEPAALEYSTPIRRPMFVMNDSGHYGRSSVR